MAILLYLEKGKGYFSLVFMVVYCIEVGGLGWCLSQLAILQAFVTVGRHLTT